MRKKFSIIMMLLLCVSIVFSGCGSKSEDKKEVYVYNVGDYIDMDILNDFEKETGIKVIYETYDTNEEMYQKISKGGGGYDVIVPSDYMVSKMAKEGLLEKINFDNVKTYNNIDEKFKGLSYDLNNEYSVPYMWGTLGIAYNKTMVKEEVKSWNILWNEKYKNQILMINSQRDTIAVALDKLGYPINSTDAKQLEAAKQELIKQKPLVKSYVNDEGKGLLVAEEAAMLVAYSGDAVFMKTENPNIEYVVPEEGSNFWVDAMCIPKGAKHKEEAEIFINYMNKPEVALKNVEYIGYSTPNKETFEMLPDEIKNDKTAYPNDEDVKDAEVFIDLEDAILEYDKIWTEILAQ